MIFKDYYKILGLENNKVSIDEIKIAFREQAKKYHPDVSTDRISEEKFKDINEAYRILSDTNQKKKYDRTWYANVGKRKEREQDRKQREKKASLLELLFGNFHKDVDAKPNKKVPKKGENIETEIQITVEEAFFGKKKSITLRTVEGKMKKFTVEIPAGIRNNEKIRLIGQGKPGENGGKNGDLFIKINIENSKKYMLQGIDLYTNLLLTPWEAALGTKVLVDAIDESLQVYIPQGISSGETIKIPSKGYKDGKGGRGDLIVEVKIVIPKKITKEEEILYKKLSEISKFEPRNT